MNSFISPEKQPSQTPEASKHFPSTEQALDLSEERFRLLFERNLAVMLIIDPYSGNLLDANQAAARFYGCTREQLRRMNITQINILPGEEVFSAMQRANKGIQGAFIFPHRLFNGEQRIVEVHSSPIELDGKPALCSIVHDITARVQAEELLRESERTLRAVLNASTDMIVLKDTNLVYRYANPAACALMGKTEAEIIGKTHAELFPPELASAYQASDVSALMTRQPESGDYQILSANGLYWVNVIHAPILDEEGRCTGLVSVMRDITERKRMETALAASEQALRYTAIHDILTGLHNRAHYEEILTSLNFSSQYPISILMIDVDDLKVVNDSLGHSTGDQMLRCTGQILSQSTRAGDFVMRTGGDEFILILPNTNIEQSQRVRERIEQAITTANLSGANPFQISLSIGCQTSSTPGILHEAIIEADTEMYRIKRQKKHSSWVAAQT